MEAIAEARRPSTLEVYEGKWRVFAAWCSEEALTPTELSPPQLANFFLWLFNVKGYATSTIKGYRSMIATTYRHLGRPDPGKDNDLSDLIANLERRRPVVRSLVPRWNLPWVLKWLSSERFEPLSLAPLREVTLKTCFLLALATAARVGELHALSTREDCLQKRQDGSYHLMTDPAFIAKNRLPSVGSQSIHLVPIKSVDRSPFAQFQCPVRALRIYLHRTKQKRGGRTRLFLPLRENRQDITIQSISSWIRQVIKGAYDDLSPTGSKDLRIKAHEVRAVSASVALMRNCALKDILDAVSWKSDSVFARCYLRDMSAQRTDLDSLGAVAAAHHLLPATSD